MVVIMETQVIIKTHNIIKKESLHGRPSEPLSLGACCRIGPVKSGQVNLPGPAGMASYVQTLALFLVMIKEWSECQSAHCLRTICCYLGATR